MSFLYRLSLQAYYAAIRVAALRNEKAKKWITGRKHVWGKLKGLDTSGGTIWFHCSSLGEFEQGRPLIEKLKSAYSELPIILTFFSPSGYEIRKEYPLADRVIYLPLDSPGNAEKLISLLRPKLAIFIKYDYWYYYFRELSIQKIPLLVISAIFRPSQPFFKLYGSLHRDMLDNVYYFFVQDQQSKDLLAQLDFSNVSVIPDTRIDRVHQIAQAVIRFPEIGGWKGQEPVLIGGSTYREEDEMISRIMDDKVWEGKVIIAPHNVDGKRLEEIEALFHGPVIRFSSLKGKPDQNARVLLIDNVGMLSSLYQFASIAFIGGGFGKSIHNILEPAAFGLPLLFGPHHHKFHEAKTLIGDRAAFEVSNYDEVRNAILFLKDEANRKHAGSASTDFILRNTGGTEKVMEYIREKILLR